MNRPLILASASPARAALLAAAGVAVSIQPATVDEEPLKSRLRAAGRDAGDAALALATLKAVTVGESRRESLVIGADQILDCDGRWYDKPGDQGRARADLQALRGKMHVQATAVCLALNGERVWYSIARPRLHMRDFSDPWLDGYLRDAGPAILGCAGAYQLEGIGVQLFAAIEGDYFAILGLPMLPLLAFLRERGVLAR